MGRDKAGLLLDGKPLWQRQLGVLRAAGLERVVLIRRPGDPAPAAVECWRDAVPGIGPLGGLHAALRPGGADWVAVLAVDMPGVDPEWFRWLARFCLPGVGAMARHAEGCEPLAAIYPAAALAEVEARIARGEHSLQRLAAALAHAGRMILVPLPAADAPRIASVNTAAQFAAWEEASRPSSRQSSP
jgi:molybdopterin-guanine dinucleotide biosynthesis protein A